jgi:hypothetical protein
MDQIEYFSRYLGLFEMIFQHFNGDELIKFSEINTFWFSSIAFSRKLMKKIKVVIRKPKFSSDKFMTTYETQLLKNSLREYQNFEITSCVYLSCELSNELQEILSAPEREWKSISITKTCFPSTEDLIGIFKAIEKNVENLIIENLSVVDSTSGKHQQAASLKFGKLKSLKIQHVDRNLFEQAFCWCENVEELHLLEGYYSLGSKGTQLLLKILQRNKKLKKFHISSHIFSQIFYKDISESVSFRLIRFTLNNVCEASFDGNIQLNFFYFLLAQMEHLESVTLKAWLGEEILKLLFEMPKLKSLKLKGVHCEKTNIPWEDLNLNPSQSITHLNYQDISCNDVVFKTVLNATPLLKSLSLYSMDYKMMKHFVSTEIKLEKLCVECLLGSEYYSENVARLIDETNVGLSVK